jgi:hypothetical protein
MSESVTPSDDGQTFLGANPDVERLYDNIQATLPSITLPLLKLAAWNAIEEFAIRSTYFRDEVSWQMGPGVNQVDFNPYSAEFTVCWVLAQSGLFQWRVAPPAQLKDLVTPVSTLARQGKAILALKPLSFEVELPPEMWSNWFETILDGTLFRLYGQPGKPWSAPSLATYHGTRFRQGMMRARDISNRAFSNQQGPQVRFPYFARGRSGSGQAQGWSAS